MKGKLFSKSFWIFILLFALPGVLLSQTVTIGTTLPARATLEVHGVAGLGYTCGILGGDGAGISLQRNWPTIGFNEYNDGLSRFMSNGHAAIQFLNPVTGELAIDMLGNGNTDDATPLQIRALSINTAGNVGIGTTAFNASLYAKKGTNLDGAVAFIGTDYTSYFYYSTPEDTYIRTGKLGGNVYINDIPGGNIIFGEGDNRVGINSTNPQFSLEIKQVLQSGIKLTEPTQSNHNWEQALGSYGGGPESSLNYFYGGLLKCYIRPTDGVLIVASDRRIKTNITPLPSVLEKILQLNPVTYEMIYNNPDHKTSWGFIAQEVQQVFPEMVTVSSHEVAKGVTIPDFHALDYNAFKMIAVKGVQEEQGIIQQQESVQDEISKRLDAIERKLKSKK